MTPIGPMATTGLEPAMMEAATISGWVASIFAAIVVLGLLYYLAGRGRASAESRTGLVLGLRGLLAKELRSRSRGWRPMWLLTGYLAGLTLAVAGFLALMSRVGGVVTPVVGVQLFSTLALGSVLLLAFITPALTVGAVSGERERRTLELLLVTRASALGLVGGKLLGSLFYILFLLAASMPAFALVYLFGGVPLSNLGMVLAVAAVTALAHAALGLLLSALLRRTIVASVVAYLVVLVVVFGLPFVAAVFGVAQQIQRSALPEMAGAPPVYLYASPITSLASVLPSGSSGWGMPLVGDVVRMGLSGASYGAAIQPATPIAATSVYVVRSNPMTGQVDTAVGWSPWVYHFLFSAAFTLLSLFLAAVALAPVKPWTAWRIRRRATARTGVGAS